ncbi:MAG: carbon-monoxide dehydrogenase medium subunit [Acidobacteriota bacterium]|nr:MAG: carbon-monoxide dehydrogenase medium subunit [Acidobacteriota bacterium]
MREIRSTGGGIEIGAMATLREVIRHPDVSSQFGILGQAASKAASPQIQNQGTLGGNVGQDTRCWYYRDGWSCYRAGGNICYADTPTAMNREHAILGASRCVAVNPSDTAPVLVALDAEMVVVNNGGERVIPAQDFFIGPAVDIERMTALQPGDILTQIRIPSTWANARFYFEKARDRQVWDFPLANVASAAKVNNGVIEDIRIVANGVAPYPVRFIAAEDAVRGQQVGDQAADQAGQIAIRGVNPLAHNGYKVTLLRNLVMRSVRGEA